MTGEIVTVGRTYSWYRPLKWEGYEFGNIKIHDGEKVLFETLQGWFTHATFLKSHWVEEDIIAFRIHAPRKALKVNLSRKDNFIVKEKCEYHWPERAWVLYIHVSDIEVSEITERLAIETATERNYLRVASLVFRHGYSMVDSRKVLCVGLKEACCPRIIFSRTEPTEFGKTCQQIASTLKEKENIELSVGQVEKILKHYTMTPAGGKDNE